MQSTSILNLGYAGVNDRVWGIRGGFPSQSASKVDLDSFFVVNLAVLLANGDPPNWSTYDHHMFDPMFPFIKPDQRHI